MLSGAYAFKIKAHFSLHFMVNTLPRKMQKIISLFASLLVIFFLVGFVYHSFKFVIGVKGHLAPALQIPMEIPYSACIVGSMLMLFYVLKTFIKDINSKNPME
jgi:TRAP-type C4-dicarboxylate transport system permease small subunit